MKLKDVPADLLDLAWDAWVSQSPEDESGAIRATLAAVLPAHERQVRERVAEQILTERAEREQRTPDGRPIAAPATPEHVHIRLERRKQAERDAQIARGEL